MRENKRDSAVVSDKIRLNDSNTREGDEFYVIFLNAEGYQMRAPLVIKIRPSFFRFFFPGNNIKGQGIVIFFLNSKG